VVEEGILQGSKHAADALQPARPLEDKERYYKAGQRIIVKYYDRSSAKGQGNCTIDFGEREGYYYYYHEKRSAGRAGRVSVDESKRLD